LFFILLKPSHRLVLKTKTQIKLKIF
jgi:hypothetical protein